MKLQSLQPGSIFFDRFEVQSWLWVGEVSSVYCCTDLKRPNRKVALKVLYKEALKDTDPIHRFLLEVDLMNRFSHPNIVRPYEVFFDDHYLAYSMDYFANGTLADEISTNNPLEISRIILLLTQTLRALKVIHAAGVIHRDLKPENILIDDEGFIQIADFGIAVESSEWERFGNAGITGTISYVSPEYIEHGQYSERSDIYAIGTILYELITGDLPFKGKSLLETIRMKVRFDPVPPHILRPECPAALSQAAMKAMSRNPEDRYATVEEMITDLSEHLRPFHLAMISNIGWRIAA